MPTEMEAEAKRKRLATGLKWGGVLVGTLLIAPLTSMILSGILGAAALLVAGVAGYISIELAPWFAMKIANWRMKLITMEASKNPIETMHNVYLEQSRIIKEKDMKVVNFEGQLGDYHDKMLSFKKRYPEEAERYGEVENKMIRALASMKRRQIEAKKIQAEYKLQIEKAEAIYEMAKATMQVSELAGDVEQQIFMDIKKQVSFDTVNRSFNVAVAALSREVDSDIDYKALPSGDTVAEIISSKEKVTA